MILTIGDCGAEMLEGVGCRSIVYMVIKGVAGWIEDQFTHSNPLLPQGLFIASITPKTPQIKPSIPGTTDNKIVSAFTHPVA